MKLRGTQPSGKEPPGRRINETKSALLDLQLVLKKEGESRGGEGGG